MPQPVHAGTGIFWVMQLYSQPAHKTDFSHRLQQYDFTQRYNILAGRGGRAPCALHRVFVLPANQLQQTRRALGLLLGTYFSPDICCSAPQQTTQINLEEAVSVSKVFIR